MLKYIVVFDYLSYTLCYIHNGDASTQDNVGIIQEFDVINTAVQTRL